MLSERRQLGIPLDRPHTIAERRELQRPRPEVRPRLDRKLQIEFSYEKCGKRAMEAPENLTHAP